MTVNRFFAFALFIALCVGCADRPQRIELTGQTMGTTYNVVVWDETGTVDEGTLRPVIEETLAQVNARFSNWDATSEVSQFNARQSTAPVAISEDFHRLLDAAHQVHRASDGQFDVTLGPLIELWGFGEPGPSASVPTDAAIAATLDQIGQDRILAWTAADDGTASPTLRKTIPTASIYLAAIAKGFGIDAVGDTLSDLGHENFMVEIGGDLLAKGKNHQGKGWRIGIERPDQRQTVVEEIVQFTDLGMATSGDYRNYFEQDGVRYSHIIDAKTGLPVAHKTASVTVFAQNAMMADAWATALLVLGRERGLQIAEKQNIAALFIERQDGAFDLVRSSRFEDLQAAQKDPAQ